MGSSPPKGIKVSLERKIGIHLGFSSAVSVYFSGRICLMVDSDQSMIITRLLSVLRIDSFM